MRVPGIKQNQFLIIVYSKTCTFRSNQMVQRWGLNNMERPMVSQMVIDAFANIVDKQDQKGIKKYNMTIDEAADQDYDWNEMALEEGADLYKYLVKENMKLRKENAGLKKIIDKINGYFDGKLLDTLKEKEGDRKNDQ